MVTRWVHQYNIKQTSGISSFFTINWDHTSLGLPEHVNQWIHRYPFLDPEILTSDLKVFIEQPEELQGIFLVQNCT